MSQREEYGGRLDEAYWEVNAAASRLISYGCGVSAKYLSDRRLRMQFNRELAYYARRVMDDVYERKISAEEGLEALRAEKDSLKSQSARILSQSLGVIGGAGQVITGVSICYGSMGLLCAFAGAPLVAHGGNNLYENTRGLYEGRGDVQGPVRKAYQGAAEKLGYTEREGNLAYLGSDFLLSLGGLARPVVKPGGWKLFKYHRVDKEMAVRQMGKGALTAESLVNTNTTYEFYKEIKE
ncbi:DUF4225 domain-containing protein [Pseudomonas entomophila]|uniref:DUF4225 domain-containing protein n=1 Tax=Pseudomonas entomophila TaxID=312306 RepID=UPI002404C454|nr:DUF4225 domain-containing protein [Pseudomonas entomophila]MDF9618177.1 DUF4225 domain-containing protein [Pseudomonas entomophila]